MKRFVTSVRRRFRLRSRLQRLNSELSASFPHSREREKMRHELGFWVHQWDAKLKSGQFWNGDIETLLRPLGEWPTNEGENSHDYASVRWLEARAHGLRILKEVGVTEPTFFAQKIVADIGPGAICFLEASGARIGIGIEPLAQQFAAHNLLLPSKHVTYLPVAAEDIPLVDCSIDIAVSRNNLDHVADPLITVSEVYRILKPGGFFILIVHLEPEPSITEPHAFDVEDVHRLIRGFVTIREVIEHGGRTASADTLAGIYHKPTVG